MYIEFDIQAHEYVPKIYMIRDYLAVWAKQQDIPYREKAIKRKLRISFDDDRHYAVFSLTWNPNFRTNYRIVTDLNNKI